MMMSRCDVVFIYFIYPHRGGGVLELPGQIKNYPVSNKRRAGSTLLTYVNNDTKYDFDEIYIYFIVHMVNGSRLIH